MEYLFSLTPKAVKFYIGDFPVHIQQELVKIFPKDVVDLYSK